MNGSISGSGAILSPKARVTRDIIQGLYEGRYKAGERLFESDMTSRHAVSRGTVREALNGLSAMGVVDLTPQRGARIRSLTRDNAADILVVLQGLIGIASRLAARNVASGADPGLLTEVVSRMEAHHAEDGTMGYAMLRDEFYTTLTRITGNAELSRLLPSMAVHLIRVQFRDALLQAGHHRHRDYRQIIEAILGGQAEVAEATARFHLQRSIDALALQTGQP
jgi:DNA-binding GntR family transcriptional regulator